MNSAMSLYNIARAGWCRVLAPKALQSSTIPATLTNVRALSVTKFTSFIALPGGIWESAFAGNMRPWCHYMWLPAEIWRHKNHQLANPVETWRVSNRIARIVGKIQCCRRVAY
jgi:hypothetical protein